MIFLFMMGVTILLTGHSFLMMSMIIMITLIYALMIYSCVGLMWFGYILLLVMLSGVMVLFTYMASFNPNDSFEFSGIVWGVLGGMMLKLSSVFLVESDVMMVFSIWEGSMSILSLYVVGLLFIIMMGVTWLTEFNLGPVRVECEDELS